MGNGETSLLSFTGSKPLDKVSDEERVVRMLVGESQKAGMAKSGHTTRLVLTGHHKCLRAINVLVGGCDRHPSVCCGRNRSGDALFAQSDLLHTGNDGVERRRSGGLAGFGGTSLWPRA